MLFAFDADHVAEPRITRIRDIASLLKNVNEASNRNEALHLLRHLVARLCNLSVKTFLGAKNLQPEINNLNTQLLRFINGWLCPSLPGLTRTVVRNLSSVIGKPNLIDQLWNDTIRLAEVEVRGSAIVNELRRSSHHALGQRTLHLAETYLDFLDKGESRELARLGFASPSEADLEARKREEPRKIVARVVEDLGRLLGTSETVARIQEWQESYAENLLQCQFGTPIEVELETLITKGINARNRWVYYHHLRTLLQKAEDFSRPKLVTDLFKNRLDALQELRPDDPSFDAEEAERLAREAVEAFVSRIRATYQDELFEMLGSVLDANENSSSFETFTRARDLRVKLQDMVRAGGFTAQRYFLQQLDCLLEEMNYLAVRRIATRYADSGVDLDQCLEIIRISILNLEFDGLDSHELFDLAGLLSSPARTEGELLDVLTYVSRHYHKIRQKVTVPYEKMSRHLGLEEEDLRTVLANMQRYMHDLNTVVHFSDIAVAFIREQQTRGAETRGIESRDVEEPPASHSIIHISHRDEVEAGMRVCGSQPNLRERYGGKGSSLLYVSDLDLPTRDGFILPTTIPRADLHRSDLKWLEGEITRHLHILEDDIAKQGGIRKRLGDENEPLVLAVRGGSVFSMPGMLSTIVFVGMNDSIAEALAQHGPWRAYDSYRRFLASYGLAMWDVDLETFNVVDDAKRRYGVEYKTDLPWKAMREIAEESKTVLRDHGLSEELEAVLADPMRQLVDSVTIVFESWNRERAQRYRDIKGISHSWQTAAIVQEMAFGNGRTEPIGPEMDETLVSLTGVIPRTTVNEFGIRDLSGEFKFSAAGDDLVGGVTSSGSFHSIAELDLMMPMLGRRLRHVVSRLRRFMGTDQEVEFTVENGILSVLQSRTAETYADEAIDRFVDPGEPASRGLGVRGGGFRGMVAFDDADREELAATDFSSRDDVDGVLMVLENPTPEEIPMIISADGLLTAKGGSTSHAAVAANGIEDRNFSSVMSAAGLQVDLERREAVIVDAEGNVRHRLRKGDIVSLHGTSGEVYIGTRSLSVDTETA
jgi:phosphohistidine swiveling domain-containing protein